MPHGPPIFLAMDDGSSALEIIIWIVAGVIWFISQAAAARKKQARKAQGGSEARPAAGAAGGGDAPTPEELAEIFKRLGADIPGTPRPSQRPPLPTPSLQRPRPAPRPVPKTAATARVQPKLAQRLVRARQEADQAAQRAEAERIALQAIVPGVQSRAGETQALETATRHTGTILPRLYAMSMRLINLPTLPMPGFDRRSYSTRPFRTKLRGRREVRDALIAQTFLQPPKSALR